MITREAISVGFRLYLLFKTVRLQRSTYHYQLKQLCRLNKDKEFKAKIQTIFTEHKSNYVYRRMTFELRSRKGLSHVQYRTKSFS